jgi:hypothetical protein
LVVGVSLQKILWLLMALGRWNCCVLADDSFDSCYFDEIALKAPPNNYCQEIVVLSSVNSLVSITRLSRIYGYLVLIFDERAVRE